ncbi:MAG TPA: hypothetical protein VKC61_06495 [Pyrinomonadaceae bacterium]|nr:hypothetical protein [Pyrinomonadaceae bacterium]
MRKRFWGIHIPIALVLLFISSSALIAQRRPNRPAAAPPARNDLKITYRTTTSGHSMENTTMLKGARERTEMKIGYGRDIINVTQCDLKRTIQISDSAKKYVITPMETADAPPSSGQVARPVVEPSRNGGVITYTTNAVDTGERKEMFGFQARHVKTSMIVESSPDACSQVKQRVETDGWYIDFSFGLNCDLGGRAAMGVPPARGGCHDVVRFNRQGAARTGYALQETTTSYGPDGRVAFSSTKEVVELSREPLDAALFDIPAGYVEAASSQELYAMPSIADVMQMSNNQQPAADDRSNASSTSNAKASGAIRVGVVQINNKTDRGVSQESLRQRLIGELQGDGVEAVPLNALSPREAEAEAKAKQCDFILYTDLTGLKASAAKKLGGFLGRATGVGSGGVDKTEAKVEFQLFAVGETSARLKSAATAKEEGDEASAGTALDQEAKQVSAEMRKSRRG